MIFAVLHADSEMTEQEIRRECSQKKWLPLMTCRPKGQPEAMPAVIVFKDEAICERFLKRNINKQYAQATVGLDAAAQKWIVDQGWTLLFFDYPHKIFSNPKYDVSVEIAYYEDIKITDV